MDTPSFPGFSPARASQRRIAAAHRDNLVNPRDSMSTKTRRERTVIPANVAAEFERLALQAITSRRRRLSAKALIEVMRWNSQIEQANSLFKIDNNLAPQLARWFARRYPQHAALFEMRQVKERK
jgi:hypothetical protein